MSANPPRVSIVIPAFNAARYIAATIDGALAQTHPACDVTVVDDGFRNRAPRRASR